MIKCKEAVETCKHTGMCCLMCEDKESCQDACSEVGKFNNPLECSSAYEDTEENALAVFKSSALAIMQNIADHKHKMDELEEEDKDLRKQLTEAMQKYGIKSFDNEILKITSIDATTKTTIDSKKLKEEAPEIFKKYSKVSSVKAYVKIEVK